MSRRLFVDCDDTLIKYVNGEHTAFPLHHNEPYEINQPLVGFIKRFRRLSHDALIVIWSGWGARYAEVCARLAGLRNLKLIYLIKDKSTFGLVRWEDVVIDDQPIRVAAPVLSPDDPGLWADLG